MASKLAGVNFDWRFDLEYLDFSNAKEQLIIPLLFNVTEYQLRENELIRVVQNKDKEIEDYKAQGAKLSRSLLHYLILLDTKILIHINLEYLETEVFNKDGFNSLINKRKADNVRFK